MILLLTVTLGVLAQLIGGVPSHPADGVSDLEIRLEPVAGSASETIEGALLRARNYRNTHPNADVTVAFAPGFYRLDHTLALGPADSGTPAHPLRILRQGTGAVFISGGVEPPQAPLPDRLKKLLRAPADAHVRAFKLSPHQLDTLSFETPRSAMSSPPGNLVVFQRARKLQPSRWPRDGYALQTIADPQSGPDVRPVVALPAAETALLAREPFPLAEGYWTFDWVFERQPITRVDTNLNTMSLGRLTSTLPQAKAARFRIVNSFADIRAPGDFALDPESGILVVWPLSNDPVTVAMAPQTVSITGARDIVFDGLALIGAQGDDLSVKSSSNITFSNGFLGLSGGNGATVTDGRHISIERSVIADTGQTGVSLAGGDLATMQPGENFVRDSIIADFGEIIRSYRPGVKIAGVGNGVEGSLITDGPHAAILATGDDLVIAGNEISHVIQESSDAGAIYTGRDLSTRGISISGNYFHDIAPSGQYLSKKPFVAGVYFDDFASGLSISHNLFVGVTFPIFLNGGNGNEVSGNVFVRSDSPAISIRDQSTAWKTAAGDSARQSIGKITPALALRYGLDRAALASWNGVPNGNIVAGNYVDGPPFFNISPGIDRLQHIEQPSVLRGSSSGVTPAAIAKRTDGRAIPNAQEMDVRARLANLAYAALFYRR